MKTALLVISFGTTHLDTMEKTIVATENALAVAFPDITVFRAFTSGVVRKRLKAKFDMQVDGIEEAMARIYAADYDRVVVQPTLLIRVLQEAYPVDDDTILLLMGHGTEHAANDIYIRLAQKMRKLPMRLCTVEGTPSFDDAIEELTAQPQRKVQLAPMLFVAGDHAKNDMAGDEPDSLRSMLKAKGYAVSCAIQGLGELADIRNMYVEKAREAFV